MLFFFTAAGAAVAPAAGGAEGPGPGLPGPGGRPGAFVGEIGAAFSGFLAGLSEKY